MVWVPPQVEPERRISGQEVCLGSDPRKHQLERRQGREESWQRVGCQTGYHHAQLEKILLWSLETVEDSSELPQLKDRTAWVFVRQSLPHHQSSAASRGKNSLDLWLALHLGQVYLYRQKSPQAEGCRYSERPSAPNGECFRHVGKALTDLPHLPTETH